MRLSYKNASTDMQQGQLGSPHDFDLKCWLDNSRSPRTCVGARLELQLSLCSILCLHSCLTSSHLEEDLGVLQVASDVADQPVPFSLVQHLVPEDGHLRHVTPSRPCYTCYAGTGQHKQRQGTIANIVRRESRRLHCFN